MSLLYLKNIVRKYISSSFSIASNARRLFCSSNTTLTGLSSSTLTPIYDFPKFTFVRYSRFSSVHLWRTQNGFLSFGVINTSRTLCSDSCGLAEPLDCSQNALETNSDVDKVYKTIWDNSEEDSNLGKALDDLGVGMTTDLVSEILDRLQFDEKLAFRFFHWVAHQPNYYHEWSAYNSMIDILSSTRERTEQFRLACEMLDYMKRNKKRVVPVEILLTILRKYCKKYLTHVRKYDKETRIVVKTKPEINALNLLLDSLCKCSLVEYAEDMFGRMRKSVKPDTNTFNIFFFGWCRVGNPVRAMETLEEMLELGVTPDSFAYTAAINTYCRAGMLDEAIKLFAFMRTNGLTFSAPTAKTYAIMIMEFIKNDRIDEAFEYLGQMMNSGCLPDVSTYKTLIEGMCLAGKVNVAYKFLDEMGNRGYPCDVVTYNCFLKVLCNNKQRNEAFRLFGVMLEKGCEPSVQTYNMLISMLFEMGDPDTAVAAWDEMYKRGCAQDADTYCATIEGLFRCGRGEDACVLVEEMVTKRMKLSYGKFDLFLAELSRIGNLRAIYRLSEHMRTFYRTAMDRRLALVQKQKFIRSRQKK